MQSLPVAPLSGKIWVEDGRAAEEVKKKMLEAHSMRAPSHRQWLRLSWALLLLLGSLLYIEPSWRIFACKSGTDLWPPPLLSNEAFIRASPHDRSHEGHDQGKEVSFHKLHTWQSRWHASVHGLLLKSDTVPRIMLLQQSNTTANAESISGRHRYLIWTQICANPDGNLCNVVMAIASIFIFECLDDIALNFAARALYQYRQLFESLKFWNQDWKKFSLPMKACNFSIEKWS